MRELYKIRRLPHRFRPDMAVRSIPTHLPESMRGECCQYWDLFRRVGELDNKKEAL